MVTKKDIVERRRTLSQLAEKKHAFNKGDRRVQTPRVCVACGRPLSSLILHENKYIVCKDHTRYYLGGWVTADVCTDINSCYRTLRRKGELIENGNG